MATNNALNTGTPGQAITKNVSDNTKSTVASVSAATVANRVASFADTTGTVQDGGIVLPTSSTAGQVMRTGATASTFTAQSAVAFQNIQVFTSDGTFNVPTSVDRVYVECWGAGGGGGSNQNGAFTGGGGGGGAYSAGIVTATPGGSVSVTIGAGGTGATANTADSGGAGNDTSFGASIVAKGGSGGAGANGSASGGAGGVAGSGTGTVLLSGGMGWGTDATFSSGVGGMGGASPRLTWNPSFTVGDAGAANSGNGGHGGSTGAAGGAGGSGYCVVWY
jgi:hypothetical protein